MPVNILVFLLCEMLLAMGLTAAHNTWCETGNFTTNSTYRRNRDIILASLSANVSGNGGFFSGSVGQDPDKVYAFGLCRGDSSPEVCSDRIVCATKDILANCNNRKEAISWAEGNPPCIVRYANRSIFGILELDPTSTGCNENYIDSDLTQFEQIWENLTDSLVRKASMGSSMLKFATKEIDFTSLRRIYSLMQCTPDLSQSDCAKCLRVSVNDYRRHCHGRRGGYVHKPNCFFRWDLCPFYDSSADASSLSPPHSTDTITNKDKGSAKSRTAIFIIVPVVTLMAILAFTCTVLQRMRKKMKMKWEKKNGNLSTRLPFDFSMQSLQLDFNAIKEATVNFSDNNKLGQGGFGTVYKGTLPDGQEVAVKRLSRNSEQGELEFKNEVVLMAKLQHRNLVRLIGFCLEEEERLLIYEFVPKSSLNNFIFHPTNRVLLNWEHRYKIIMGIARGIHYLHEDSQLRVIHRDLKTENILLDAKMNPKISDFGMAKLFRYDQTHTDTTRVAGTFGYMAPEYVKHGHFSVKSDVYSFGVLVLEIISGKKISRFVDEEAGSLPTYVWKNWKKGTGLDVVDPILRDGSRSELMKCIHLVLLCVQEDVANRPTMATVVLTLSRCTNSLPEPSKPGFCQNSSPEIGELSLQNGNTNVVASDDSKIETTHFTQNEVSISDIVPR